MLQKNDAENRPKTYIDGNEEEHLIFPGNEAKVRRKQSSNPVFLRRADEEERETVKIIILLLHHLSLLVSRLRMP